MDNWRTTDQFLWMVVVKNLLDDLPPVVVVDTRVSTDIVTLEFRSRRSATNVQKKILLTTEFGDAPVFDEFEQTIEVGPWIDEPITFINEGHEFIFNINEFMKKPDLDQDFLFACPSDLISQIRTALSLPKVVW